MKQCILIFLIAVPLFAQTQSVSENIVVTASSVPESVESTPASVTVITRNDIEKREVRDVVDILREVPGVSIARTGSSGKTTTLFIRGGSSKQALVLWNGVEMNNAYFSGYNFGQLSTAGVEKVEVIRGPYSALYGSDAVSGVVNVLTSPQRTSLDMNVQAGENGLRNGSIAGAIVQGSWSGHAAIERRDDDGFAPNDDFASDTVSGGVQFTPRDSFSIALMARRSTYDLGIPRNVNAAASAFVATLHRREDGSETQYFLPVRITSGRMKYELRLAESRRKEHFEDPDAPFGAEVADTDAWTRSARGSVQSSTTFGVMTLGGEVERSNVDHTDTFGLDVKSRSRDSDSVFAEDRLSKQTGVGTLEIAAGVRYDRYDSFGSEISPRLAVALVRGNRKFRAAYGTGFRAPAIGELYAPFFGNADLDAEKSKNVEIGFDQYVNGATLSITAFHSDYDNLIAFGTNRFENIDEARADGIEIGATRHFSKLSAGLSYTYLKAIDRGDDKQLVRRPKHSGSLSLGYDFGPVNAEIVLVHSGARRDISDLSPFPIVTNDSFTTADVTAHYELGSFSPFVKIENATDEKYDEVFGYPSARRRAIVGVRYSMR